MDAREIAAYNYQFPKVIYTTTYDMCNDFMILAYHWIKHPARNHRPTRTRSGKRNREKSRVSPATSVRRPKYTAKALSILKLCSGFSESQTSAQHIVKLTATVNESTSPLSLQVNPSKYRQDGCYVQYRRSPDRVSLGM